MKAFALLISFAMMLTPRAMVAQVINTEEQIWIPSKEKAFGGRMDDIKLDAVLYRPNGYGPFPFIVFNHGFSGGTRKAARFSTISRFLPSRGIAVIELSTRGINGSGGYANEPSTCDIGENSAGVSHAIEDVDAAIAWAKAQVFLDSNRILVGGHSRGGILSVVYAARRPDLSVKGVVNFVGIWNDDRCAAIDEALFSEAGGSIKVANLWLYARRDSMTSDASAKGYAELFKRAGGQVTFRLYSHDFGNGHGLIRNGQDLWLPDLGHFLDQIGFSSTPKY